LESNADNPTLHRLKLEIARDRARLSDRLDDLGLSDREAPQTAEPKTGRLYRVFSLMHDPR
jgi:hypothetical protein